MRTGIRVVLVIYHVSLTPKHPKVQIQQKRKEGQGGKIEAKERKEKKTEKQER